MQFKSVVIKFGTNVLTREDGHLDLTNISHLVDQVAALKKAGVAVVLVSSGAVGAGRSMVSIPPDLSKIVRRQVLSAVGQVRLMEIYRGLFENHQLHCAQVLACKEDFRDRTHYINMRNCLTSLMRDTVVPIVNENDVISISELMFTDNDELAGLVAAMINAEALLILSTVDGLMTGHPDHPDSQLITTISASDRKSKSYILPSKSSFGRGGMQTKFRIAQKAAKVGIDTFIANGRRSNIIVDILQNDYIGTHFVAGTKLSNVKKWIAYYDQAHKGKVVLNAGAVAALTSSEEINSLLPVGVVRLEGEFQKGDLLQLLDEQGRTVGYGIAQYSSAIAMPLLGQKGQKPLIHYDYLYLDLPH
ncbi:MAG: glutamate 5-kinase [Bacteroidota bacterium]